MRKTQIPMNKLVCIGLSVLDLSKTVMVKKQNFVNWIHTASLFM